MKPKTKKYSVEWDCPKCGNSHKWWWDNASEAFSEDACVMKCDRCDAETWCQGDGSGFYEPMVKDEKGPKSDIETRVSDLESLENDLHSYVRGLEDKVNANHQSVTDAINSVVKNSIRIEGRVDEHRGELDNIGRRITEAELAIWRLENEVKPGKSTKPTVSITDLIDGPKQPFHERLREGCLLDIYGETMASILRFIAVEVERMTERDMGGSYTISNLKVAQQLREFAAEAALEDNRA